MVFLKTWLISLLGLTVGLSAILLLVACDGDSEATPVDITPTVVASPTPIRFPEPLPSPTSSPPPPTPAPIASPSPTPIVATPVASPTPPATTEPFANGALVTFDVLGEKLIVLIRKPETIETALAVSMRESRARIPIGPLVKGEAFGNPWSWHLDPDKVRMAELTVEVCDGLPSHVEGDLAYWVGTVKFYCPWSAAIVSIEEYGLG